MFVDFKSSDTQQGVTDPANGSPWLMLGFFLLGGITASVGWYASGYLSELSGIELGTVVGEEEVSAPVVVSDREPPAFKYEFYEKLPKMTVSVE